MMPRSRRGRHLDHKYPLVRYDFDRVGWLRLQASQGFDRVRQRAATAVADAGRAVEARATQWGRSGAGALAALRGASVAGLDGGGDGAVPELGVPLPTAPTPHEARWQ